MLWVQVKTVIRAFVPFVVLLGLSTVHTHAAGYRLLEHDDFMVHVWYPTDTLPEDGRMGPFDVIQAVDAPVRAGSYQVVLVSHGFNGVRAIIILQHRRWLMPVSSRSRRCAADHYVDTDWRAAALHGGPTNCDTP